MCKYLLNIFFETSKAALVPQRFVLGLVGSLIVFNLTNTATAQPIDNGDGTMTLMLQPAPGLNDGTDTGGPDDGKDAILQYGYASGSGAAAWTQWPSNFYAQGYAYYQFNLESILSPDEEIVSAQVVFHQKYNSSAGPYWVAGPETYVLESAAAAWNEMTINWGNQPYSDGFFSTMVTVNPNPVPSLQVVTLDITPLVQAWHSGVHPNYGFLYRMADRGFYNMQDNYVHLSDYTDDPTYRPMLVVTYTSGGGGSDCEQVVTELMEEIALLDGEILNLQSELTSLQLESQELADEMTALAATNQSLESEISALQGEVTTLSESVTDLKDENDILTESNTALSADLKEAATGLAEIKALISTPQGLRSSQSKYQGELGAALNDVINALLSPPGDSKNNGKPKK